MNTRNKAMTLIIGLGLIAAGVLAAGSTLGLWDVNVFFPGWWTLFIIVPGIVSLVNSGPNTFSTILIVVGVFLLLGQYNLLRGVNLWQLMIPALLIILGVQIIVNRVFTKERRPILPTGGEDKDAVPQYTAIFGGFGSRNNCQSLKGGDLFALFGGGTVDFRGARVEQDIQINVTSVFGGIDIYVPPNVRVEITGISVLGGVSNKTLPVTDESLPLVIFNCTNIFGGTDLK